MYIFYSTSVKGAIMAFYLLRFGRDSTSFVIAWWVNIVIAFAVFNSLLVVTFTQCHPIDRLWDSTEGACQIDSKSWNAANSLNAISTFGILLLPLLRLVKTKLSSREIIAIGGIYTIGWIALVLSVIRVPLLDTGVRASDTSFALVPGILMSFTEATTGMMCACLPASRPVLAIWQNGKPSLSRANSSRSESRTAMTIDVNKAWDYDLEINSHPIAASRGSPLTGSPMPSPMLAQLGGVRVDRRIELTYQPADIELNFEIPPIPDVSPWEIPIPDTPTNDGTPKRSRSLTRSNSTVTARSRSRSKAASRAPSRTRSKGRGKTEPQT
jgi:hypothetical protein